MRRKTMLFACALLLSVMARAQWNGYEVKTIGTTPATTLNSGYYALFQNGHKGFAYLSETMLNLWGSNYNLAKNRINSNSPGITAFANLNQNIATGPAPNDRRWYVFKITNNGNGTCTIQCADGTFVPALGNRAKLVSSATAGVFNFHNHGNYFSFEQNGEGLNGDDYRIGYDNVSTLASWDYTTPNANGNAAWTLYPVEMTRPLSTAPVYLLRHKATGLYLHLADSYTETSHVDATTLRPVGTPFKFTANSDGGYTLTQLGTTKTLGCATGSWSAWNTSNRNAASWKFEEASANNEYYITSAKGCLGANVGEAGEGAYLYTDKGRHAESVWQLVDENTLQVVPADKKVYALYNAFTNGEYPVVGVPGIATEENAALQRFVFHAHGTDNKGTTLFRLQRATMSNEFLSWTNNSPTSVTFSGEGSDFLFLNNTNTGYGWNSGAAPQVPFVNFVGYAGGQYTVFCDKKSTTNTGFDGYSRRGANGLINNAQCARGANYNTTWRLRQLPFVYYNLVVTGWTGEGTPTVTYNHPNDNGIPRVPQTNGGGFVISYDALNSLSAANFTTQNINGVSGTVVLEGNTVKVSYKTEANVTYIYKYGDNELQRQTMIVKTGLDVPDLLPLPENVNYKTAPVGKVYDDIEFVVECEFRPNWWITPSATYETANWVYLSVGSETNRKYLHYDASHPEYMELSNMPQNTDAYKWAFIVNPYTGHHKIINKAAGPGMILSSVSPKGDGNTGGNTFPHMVSESDDLESMGMNRGWDFTMNSYTYAGFFLFREGGDVACNNRDGKFSFWTEGKGSGSTFYIVPVNDLAPVSAANLKDSQGKSIESGKTYRLVNRLTGQVIYDGEGKWTDERFARMEGRWDSNNQKWTIAADGNGFTVRNSGTNKYMTGNYNTSSLFYYSDGWRYYLPCGHLTDGKYTMYFYEADEVDGQKYYFISGSPTLSSSDGSGRTLLGCDNMLVIPYSSGNSTRAQWAIECTNPTQPEVNYVSSITSGNYYKLVSNTAQSMYMTDGGGGVITSSANEEVYNQIWQITGNNGSYTFKNMGTGKTIQGWQGKSTQWKTGDNAANFYSGTTVAGEKTVFWFATVNNTSEHQSLHSAPHQGNTVVGWQASSDASKWLLQRVDLTQDELTALAEGYKLFNNDYTDQLMNFFTDYACTQLKSNYASMSDAQLRSAMSALPKQLQDMAIRVKNNTWDPTKSEVWNRYEKDFRIHDYEIYSHKGTWGSKVGFSPFAHLTNPSGIKVISGQPVLIFVDRNKGGNVNFCAELVSGKNTSGTQYGLKRGYNIIYPQANGELFITYNTTDADRLISEYPNIKVHIEGGWCNGFFDVSRGHVNNDWVWLKNNMFKHDVLRLKGINTLIHANLGEVKGASRLKDVLKVWDFVFTTEQKVMLGDRFEGKLKAMVSAIPSGEWGVNFWNGNSGYYDGVTSSGLVNLNSFTNLGGGGGALWAISHEEGHGHQEPICVSGTREISNNALSQIVNFIWGRSTSRHWAQSRLGGYFNEGKGWVDLVSDEAGALWVTNKMWFQLWLYFHLKGDDGFFPRWIQCLRNRGGISKSTDSNNPVAIADEYMKMALAACEASQTDLYEFFKAWGFFRYIEDIGKWNGNEMGRTYVREPLTGITFYLKLPFKSNSNNVAQMEAWKQEMQSYSKKAPGVLFINDTGEQGVIRPDAEVLKFDPSLAGATVRYSDELAQTGAGCTGHFTHYGQNEADNLGFTQDGNTITITGSGAVGFKIYDNTGELIWISYWKNFTVNDAIATGIANGTYSLVASLGDDTDLLLSGPATMYTGGNHAKSFDEATGIDENVNVQTNDLRDAKIYDLQGRQLKGLQKGVNIVNGKKIVVK